MIDKPLTIDLKERQLTSTGSFRTVRENHATDPCWRLKLGRAVGLPEPSVSCALLRGEPSYNDRIGIIVFDFEHTADAALCFEQLISDGFADSIPGLKTSKTPNTIPKEDWDKLRESIVNMPNWEDAVNGGQKKSAEAYDRAYAAGKVKYGGLPRGGILANRLRRQVAEANRLNHGGAAGRSTITDPSAIHVCEECGGSGFYHGFQKTEPCSEGCLPS